MTSMSKHMSNEQRAPSCLGYIGDEILPSYMGNLWNSFINHYKGSLLNNQDSMESKAVFFFRGSLKHGVLEKDCPPGNDHISPINSLLSWWYSFSPGGIYSFIPILNHLFMKGIFHHDGTKWAEKPVISRGYNRSYPFIRPFIGVITPRNSIYNGRLGAHLVPIPETAYWKSSNESSARC